MKRFALVFMTLCIALSQQEEPRKNPKVNLQTPVKDIAGAIRSTEFQKKQQVQLDKTLFEQMNFIVQNHTEFVIIPDHDQQIKGTFDVFWKQDGVYLLANYQAGQEIDVAINSGKKHTLLHSSTFFMAGGFKIKGHERKVIKIRISTSGTFQKMIVMRISERIKTPEKAITNDSLSLAQKKLFYSYTILQSALAEAKTGFILDQRISSYVQHQSYTYFYFQIFQSLLIVLLSIIQVMVVARALKNDIVV